MRMLACMSKAINPANQALFGASNPATGGRLCCFCAVVLEFHSLIPSIQANEIDSANIVARTVAPFVLLTADGLLSLEQAVANKSGKRKITAIGE
jgi:hypothetical protein